MFRLYNSLTRKKQEFVPIKKGEVKMYICGPTVYHFAHIGNFRSYIAWDLLRRFLEYKGYKVVSVKNITDVGHFTDEDEDRGEDKMEKAAKREKKTPLEIADFYTNVFIQNEKELNILPPTYRPKATEEIEMIQKIITNLLEKGYAYDSEDGVYFDVTKFPEYGKLSGNTPEKILAGARVEVNPNKKNPADFALWKKRVGKNKLHSLHWSSPWGEGFPGWHIECSAMALRYLGESIDIHTGGWDNKFPHHESEIAQSESYTGKPFSNYWLHTEFMDFDGKKMSKSLGNILLPDDLKSKKYNPLIYRYWTLTAHYRSAMNFSWKFLDEAAKNWNKIVKFRDESWNELAKNKDISNIPNNSKERTSLIFEVAKKNNIDLEEWMNSRETKLIKALDDDLNTTEALVILHEAIKEAKKNELVSDKSLGTLILLEKWDKIFGFLPEIKTVKEVAIPQKIEDLAAERVRAREAKDFNKADQIRERVHKLGFDIIDNSDGSYTIKVLSS